MSQFSTAANTWSDQVQYVISILAGFGGGVKWLVIPVQRKPAIWLPILQPAGNEQVVTGIPISNLSQAEVHMMGANIVSDACSDREIDAVNRSLAAYDEEVGNLGYPSSPGSNVIRLITMARWQDANPNRKDVRGVQHSQSGFC
jgi:hypothetical protein